MVHAVEEAGDILRLAADALAGFGDDLRVQPEPVAMLIPAEAPGTPTLNS